MSMKIQKVLFVALLCFVSAVVANPTASIFVKDASEFATIQKDLDELKAGLGQGNPKLDSLLSEANRIAKMNDQCSMISINDVLDESCSHFYAVELPAFETKYMELTGELRLGFLSAGNTLAERTEQIKVCASALGGILFAKDQLLNLSGNLDLEPLSQDGAFDATYDFNLYFDATRMEQQKNLMERWVDKCGDVVMRKAGDEFAPLFIKGVESINDSLKSVKSNVQIVVEPEALDFYLDLAKPVSGAYYMNGAQIFTVDALPMGRTYSHIIVNVPQRKVQLPLGLDGKMQNFRGRVEFTSAYQENALVGRWLWGNQNAKNQAVAKGDISSEAVVGDASKPKLVVKHLSSLDTTALIKSVSDEEKAKAQTEKEMEEAAQQAALAVNQKKETSTDKSKIKIHVVPLAIAGAVAVAGGIVTAVFNSKAASECEKRPSNPEEYKTQLDKIESAQTVRSVGIGLIAAGIIGAGVTFFF